MKTRRDEAALARGFTLIELMVVIVILGALVALVGPNVFHFQQESMRKAAEVQIHNLKQAIDLYRVENHVLPQTLQELVQPSKKTGEPLLAEGKVPDDPWGSVYDYRPTNAVKGEYTITSSGDDKQPGTADDIVYTAPGGFK